ncbi:MAG: cytochrome c biogenesis protein CcsA [Armatimonadetes bacterium]|nr:cytochrome c biogenesis protein CcsA [Armatimonadota bacterium]NCO91597.1 cytochrome c biogenesis protein CcsA [Armatimonadota bacterium]NCP33903.1 cytochrome c biogenesis protein CcsA [Armatimonadota bacterium]NDK13471.1 cytochrome c biogenesis protein CcsA [Armatimonadota bacterium]
MMWATLSSAFLLVALAAYVVATALYPAFVLLRKPRLGEVAGQALAVAASLHFLAILTNGLGLHRAPFTQTVEALSFFAMALAFLFALMAPALRIQAAGVVLAPFAFLMGVCSFVNSGKVANTELTSSWLLVHVPIILLAYVSFTLAFAGALLYLIHDQLLKRHLLRRLSRPLPPLETTDKWVFRLVVFGFPLLTLGLITGVAWFLSSGRDLLSHGDPKVMLSLATWLVYAVYLYLRLCRHWRGRRANWLILAGFAAVLLTFFGVRHNLRKTPHRGVANSRTPAQVWNSPDPAGAHAVPVSGAESHSCATARFQQPGRLCASHWVGQSPRVCLRPAGAQPGRTDLTDWRDLTQNKGAGHLVACAAR